MDEQLTPWFPPEVKPARNGMYLTRIVGRKNYEGVLRHWDGSCWSFMDNFSDPAPFLSPRQWRGLAKEPK